MNMLAGKKTYIVALVAALYQAAYASGLIGVSPDTHELILGLLASIGAVTLRQAVAKAEPKPSDGSDTKPTP